MTFEQLLEFFNNEPRKLGPYSKTEREDLLATGGGASSGFTNSDFVPVPPLEKYGNKYVQDSNNHKMILEVMKRMMRSTS